MNRSCGSSSTGCGRQVRTSLVLHAAALAILVRKVGPEGIAQCLAGPLRLAWRRAETEPEGKPYSRKREFMVDVVARLGVVKVKTTDALKAVEADSGASVVLAAVVREFDSKADKANSRAETEASARDAVIELEQAGDSAKAAAVADLGVKESTKEAVLDAHLEICVLKTEV